MYIYIFIGLIYIYNIYYIYIYIYIFIGDYYQHINALGRCRLFFDAPKYNAHTSAGDAIWAGVPVIHYNYASSYKCVLYANAHTSAGNAIWAGVTVIKYNYASSIISLLHTPAPILCTHVAYIITTPPPINVFSMLAYILRRRFYVHMSHTYLLHMGHMTYGTYDIYGTYR